MPALALKAGAALVTLLAVAAAAHHVGGHVRNGSAPLHPQVLDAGTDAPGQGGRLVLSPGIRAAPGLKPVTSTYVS